MFLMFQSLELNKHQIVIIIPVGVDFTCLCIYDINTADIFGKKILHEHV